MLLAAYCLLLLLSSIFLDCWSLQSRSDFRQFRTFKRDIQLRRNKKSPHFKHEIDVAAACVEKFSTCGGYVKFTGENFWRLINRQINSGYDEEKAEGEYSQVSVLNDALPVCSEEFNYTFSATTASSYAVVTPGSFDSTLEACRQMGGRPVMITTPSELSFAANVSVEIGTELWTAGYVRRGTRRFKWWYSTNFPIGQTWLFGGEPPPPPDNNVSLIVESSGRLRSLLNTEVRPGLCECYEIRELGH